MSSREQKRQVLQQLHDMGFQAQEISVAIRENGYNLERCTDFLVSRQQNARPRLYVGMEVWIYSVDNEDWVPGNIVSITKQLVSIIFSGHDFRWLEKESDLFKIQDEKPPPFLNSDGLPHNSSNNNNSNLNNNNSNSKNNNNSNNNNMNPNDPNQPLLNSVSNNNNNNNNPNNNNLNNNNRGNINGNNGNNNNNNNNNNGGAYPPREDEVDYHVRFTESVLGLELYSDEDGFNCIVGRCVSNIARANVTPGSQIVQVNERWLANFRFEEIRDAVKQAAKSPPLNVTFRIKRSILESMRPNQNINLMQAPQTMQAIPSVSDTTPEDQNPRLKPNQRPAAVDDALSNSISQTHNEEKQWRPLKPIKMDFVNPDDSFEPHMTLDQANTLQVGDYIDNRDDVGRFLLASIVEKQGSRVKIHYEGWNSKWDKWYDYTSELRKFAKARSISRKPNTRFPQLKIRDYVDINPLERHPGWRPGQIRRMDKYSGQSQIVYKEDGQEFLYWAHLNNPDEIAPFMTKSAETIAKQQQQHQQHYNNNNSSNNINNNNNIDNSNIYNDSPNINGSNAISQYSSNNNTNTNNNNNISNSINGHNHKQSMTFSQSSSKVRRPLPPTLQGRSLPPKPPRKSKP